MATPKKKTTAKPTHVRAAGKGRKYSTDERWALTALGKELHGLSAAERKKKMSGYVKAVGDWRQREGSTTYITQDPSTTRLRKPSVHAQAGGLVRAGHFARHKERMALHAKAAKKKAQVEARTKKDALIRSSNRRKK
jgi:hypothetical protein